MRTRVAFPSVLASALSSYALVLAIVIGVVAMLGAQLVEVSGRSISQALQSHGPPPPNLVELRVRDRIAADEHSASRYDPARTVVALKPPIETVSTMARGLDLAEGGEMAPASAKRASPCRGACLTARVNRVVKVRTALRASVPVRRKAGPDTRTIFVRNLAALGPTYD